jgi:hypothetical protein
MASENNETKDIGINSEINLMNQIESSSNTSGTNTVTKWDDSINFGNYNIYSTHKHGFENGTLTVAQEPYESFIISDDEIDELNRLIKNAEIQKLNLEKIAIDWKILIKNLTAKINFLEGSIHKWTYLSKELNVKVNDLKSKLLEIADKISKIDIEYNFISSLLFFFAALIFIAADYGITYSIVGSVLSLDGFERMIFAAGLASLSILLKPAYDRLVEKNYLRKEKMVRFNWVILLTASLSIILLIILGVFRYHGKGVLAVAQTLTDPQQLIEAQKQVDNSYLALATYSISGVLFAIAGSICLGIAMPAFQKLISKWLYSYDRFILNRKLTLSEKDLFNANENLIHDEAQLKVNSGELAFEMENNNYLVKLDNLNENLNTYFRQKLEMSKTKSISLYRDYYNRGLALKEKYESYWELDDYVNPNNNIIQNLKTYEINTENIQNRPYIAIRKMIGENFRSKLQSSKKQSIDYYDFSNEQ